MTPSDREARQVASESLRPESRRGKWYQHLDFVGADLLDGEAALVLLSVVAALLLGWAAVDLIFPFAVLGAYLLIVSALGRVANDRHACEGSLRRALGWGALWATVYTLPLGLFVWIVHAIARR